MKKKQRSPIHAYKRLLANDHDWDYAYLIALEKKKLQRMRECIKEEHHLANNEFVVREHMARPFLFGYPIEIPQTGRWQLRVSG